MNSLKVLNNYFYKYKKTLAFGFLFVTLNSIFLTIPGYYLGKATNLLKDKVSDQSQYIECGLYLIGFALIGGFFMFLMRQTIIVISRKIEFDQKNEIYNHYQSLDQNFYKNNIGDLMHRISEDVSRVRMYTGPAIMYVANTFASILTAVIFMIRIDYRMALVVIAPLPILSIIIYKVSSIINKKVQAFKKSLHILQVFLKKVIQG